MPDALLVLNVSNLALREPRVGTKIENLARTADHALVTAS